MASKISVLFDIIGNHEKSCCFLVLTTTASAENRVKRSKMKGFFDHNKAIFWHFFKKCGDILITVLTSTSVTSLKGPASAQFSGRVKFELQDTFRRAHYRQK